MTLGSCAAAVAPCQSPEPVLLSHEKIRRIALVSDAWFPQRNGVVRVLSSLRDELVTAGFEVEVIHPDLFLTFPCPTYPEIRLAVAAGRKVAQRLEQFRPDAVHIATEGPLGHAARRWCLRHRHPFTTAYHSKFPEYINERTGVPLPWLYAALRRFHRPSAAVLAPSGNVYQELSARGFERVRHWAHGVDTSVFYPDAKDGFDAVLPEQGQASRPIFMYVGRVTVEKNLSAFLDLDLPGAKVVVGDGPQRASLIKCYPDVLFHIANGDDELRACYNAADVFVFPSRTDTFGLVMLEALACGVPVAAFPVTGPTDVLLDGVGTVGILDEDLRAAALAAVSLSPHACRRHAERFAWSEVAQQFLAALHPLTNRHAP